MVEKFRKKQVEVEVMRYSELLNLIAREGDPMTNDGAQWLSSVVKLDNGSYAIRTLEGDMLVTADDVIIKGVKSEYYPCKRDIFEITYEKVPADFIERMESEASELSEKYVNGSVFLNGDGGKLLSTPEFLLLKKQLELMREYLEVLNIRIGLSKEKKKNDELNRIINTPCKCPNC
jgi:DNA-binding transcriptional regulator GbsR (MarR family)